MKQKKGFTLIELLAVIIVLAIIALIATPIILNIINSSEEQSFKDSVYGVIKASKIALANENFEDIPEVELTFNFSTGSNVDKLDISGETPKNGYITIDQEGRTQLLINNDKYCAKKTFEEDNVTIEKYSEETCK